MRTIDDMVRQEVVYCVSTLISELAKNEGFLEFVYGDDLSELCQGKPDYESAAQDAGWFRRKDHTGFKNIEIGEERDEISWEDLCLAESIEPHYSEPLEFWIVSDWLAEELLAQGETVVKDFMGMDIWGRCTSGQAISQDGVIRRIYEKTHTEAA